MCRRVAHPGAGWREQFRELALTERGGFGLGCGLISRPASVLLQCNFQLSFWALPGRIIASFQPIVLRVLVQGPWHSSPCFGEILMAWDKPLSVNLLGFPFPFQNLTVPGSAIPDVPLELKLYLVLSFFACVTPVPGLSECSRCLWGGSSSWPEPPQLS